MNTSIAPPILDRLSALGDETRSRMVALLQESEFTVSELATVLQLPQPSVSRHLKTLTSEGWLEVRAQGRSRHYRMARDLADSAREVWAIVHQELQDVGVYASDRERARSVLSERRLKSDAFFAGAAGQWDDVRTEMFGPSSSFAPLLGLLDSRWTVADLGCGTGALTELIAPFVGRVVGIDRSVEMMSAARTRLEGMDSVDLRRGELEHLPMEGGESDVAILALVLHYVVEPDRVLREAHRILRKGGRLVIVDMRPHDRGRSYAEEMGHTWPGFEQRTVRGWLVEAGFPEDGIAFTDLPADPQAKGPLLFLGTARA